MGPGHRGYFVVKNRSDEGPLELVVTEAMTYDDAYTLARTIADRDNVHAYVCGFVAPLPPRTTITPITDSRIYSQPE